MAKDNDSRTTSVAIRLAASSGHSDCDRFVITDGVEVPRWVTFVSEAKRLIDLHDAVARA